MASICKVIQVSSTINNLCKLFSSVLLKSYVGKGNVHINKNAIVLFSLTNRNFNTTSKNNGLMEFFDDSKNWGENEVKVGRSWNKDELRIKSNTDLHKLWYILLKEHNMLLTMEQECKDQTKLFPSPERIDKVKESMSNIEEVVRERNKAYHMLETGEIGEVEKTVVRNQFGLKMIHTFEEYLIPKRLNTEWQKKHQFNPKGNAVRKFLLYHREKLYNEKRKAKIRDYNHVMGLLKRFPNMDLEALKEQYPDVNIKKCLENRKSRGHFAPK